MFAQSSENFEKEENFQKFDFLIDFLRKRLQFSILISLPKTFSPSTVNVRWKFWGSWKKRELSKIWLFDWSFETKTAVFNFDNPAEKFFAEHGNCSFKVLKNLKKKNFQKFDFLIDLLRRWLQLSILISLPKTFSPSTVIVRSKFWRNWKKREVPKVWLFIDLLRRRLQFPILISRPKIFLPSTVNVRSNFWRIWKRHRTFKKNFFSSYFTSNTNISKGFQIDT